jgi:hypothetical protein
MEVSSAAPAQTAAPTPVPSTTDPAPAAPAAPVSFDWKTSGLDDGTLAFVNEKQWKGPAEAIGSYRQLESAFGVPPERLIKLPAPRDAGDPKVWEPIWKQLGRPESPDKYVVPLPEGDTGEFANVMKPIFHKAGLSQSAVTAIATEFNAHVAAQQQAQQQAAEAKNTAEIAALKQGWGAEYDAKAAIVDRAAETFGMTQAHLDAFKTAMGPKAAMEFLYNLGSKVAVEDSTVPGLTNQTNTFNRMTPEMAKAKIEEYSAPGSGFAQLLTSKDPKQRAEAYAEWNQLHQQAYQGAVTVAPPPRR